ncbi:replication protein A, subunit RPA32 [Gymnopus androsaceus JB14]|uniref:Replication protein A, subunit RPA32 n=1 Tax=Gymnopus androsaceus JB14 TaxID=1447944 RepID=A0A6A4IC44_9AGAR|nr:replication protein A, subunit RPA32 [Gymnopus androsaceus JB14]
MSQGGGFYQQPQSSPFNPSQSSPGGGDPKRSEVSHSVRPLTIAQANKAKQDYTDAEWTLFGSEIGQVTLVGQVVDISEQATNFVYILEDGTGRMEVRRWREQNTEEEEVKWGNIVVNHVVRVTGRMKAFGSKKSINATTVRPSDDPHEIYFHTMEALSLTFGLSNGLPGGQAPSAQGHGITSPATASAYTAHSTKVANDDMAEYKNLPPLQREIIKFILAQPEHDEGGVHVGMIAKSVQGLQARPNDVSDALDALMDAGHIYTTSDDSHFQVSR